MLVFDTSTNRELGQVWVSWSNVVARLDPKEMKKEASDVVLKPHKGPTLRVTTHTKFLVRSKLKPNSLPVSLPE